MNDNEFFIRIFILVITAIIFYSLNVLSTKGQITEAIKDGADPIATACALGSPSKVSYDVCRSVSDKNE